MLNAVVQATARSGSGWPRLDRALAALERRLPALANEMRTVIGSGYVADVALHRPKRGLRRIALDRFAVLWASQHLIESPCSFWPEIGIAVAVSAT